jgi:hypothetical protein
VSIQIKEDYKKLLFPLKENIYALAAAYKQAESQSEIEK